MTDISLLLPAQKELLIVLVEAAERVPSNQRMHFIIFQGAASIDHFEPTTIKHRGFNEKRHLCFFGDIRVLENEGLIILKQLSGKYYEMDLLPSAYLRYSILKQPPKSAHAAVRSIVADALLKAERALNRLEVQRAGFGELHVPAHVILEIGEKQSEIKELVERLRVFDSETPEES